MKKLFLSVIIALMGIMTMSASTVYCKMTQSWWTADGAAVGVYYWGTSSDPAWPGIRMSPVSGQDGTWSYDLPSDVSNIIFVRVNGSGVVTDWGAKTKDLTLPTDGKNLFTITNSSPTWGDPGCDGEWSVYDGQGGGGTPGGGGETASYGIMINGTDYHAGTKNESPLDPSFTEYAVTGVSVANGATLQLWDKNNNAGWAVDLDQASVAGITRDGDHYNCTAEGCYDFYIKLKMNQDQLYIGSCSGGGDTPGGGGGTGEHTVDGLYLIGEWNGQNFGDGDDYANFIEENAFVDCKISKTFVDTDPARSACWIRAKAKLDGGTGWMFFSTDDWQGDGKQTITLYSADYLYKMGKDGTSNRWSVPTNKKLNITLKVISLDEIQLTLVDDAKFASWTCADAGVVTEIEQTVAPELDLNAPMFDVLGRKVNADYHGIVIQNGKKFIR